MSKEELIRHEELRIGDVINTLWQSFDSVDRTTFQVYTYLSLMNLEETDLTYWCKFPPKEFYDTPLDEDFLTALNLVDELRPVARARLIISLLIDEFQIGAPTDEDF